MFSVEISTCRNDTPISLVVIVSLDEQTDNNKVKVRLWCNPSRLTSRRSVPSNTCSPASLIYRRDRGWDVGEERVRPWQHKRITAILCIVLNTSLNQSRLNDSRFPKRFTFITASFVFDKEFGTIRLLALSDPARNNVDAKYREYRGCNNFSRVCLRFFF